MNIYSLQLLFIFNCYQNALIFTGVSCFSFFICLDDRIVLNYDCMIYSFIRLLLAIKPISIMQWRVEIGIFNIRFCIRSKSNAVGSLTLTPLLYIIAGTSITLLTIFLLLCSDVELNSGPTKKPNSWFNFSICNWNLNSLTSHNCEKVNLLEAYNAVNKFDIICLSESFLDSSVLTENSNLKINGYKMVRADHPNNVKGGGVCAYVRETLPFRNFRNSYLIECLTLEVTISNRKGYVITLYRSPSQTSD